MTNMVGKISVKSIGLNGEVAKGKAHGERFPLMVVYGTAREIITKRGAEGDLLNALKGTFEAVNSDTGEVFNSGILYLPGGMQEIIEAVMEEGISPDDVGAKFNHVKFAVELYATPSSNKAGYTYGARYLNDPEGADPMAEMRAAATQRATQTEGLKKLAAASAPALEAPKEEAPKEEAPKEEAPKEEAPPKGSKKAPA